jgi:hypothetical protein
VGGEPRGAGLLGRETKGEVALVSRLRAAFDEKPEVPRYFRWNRNMSWVGCGDDA